MAIGCPTKAGMTKTSQKIDSADARSCTPTTRATTGVAADRSPPRKTLDDREEDQDAERSGGQPDCECGDTERM